MQHPLSFSIQHLPLFIFCSTPLPRSLWLSTTAGWRIAQWIPTTGGTRILDGRSSIRSSMELLVQTGKSTVADWKEKVYPRTPFVSTMHQDESADLRDVGKVMKDVLRILNVPFKVRRLVWKSDLVTKRGARLATGGIVGILKKIGRDGAVSVVGGRVKSDATNKMKRTIIAIDGGLNEHYIKFRNYLQLAIVELLGEEIAQHIVIKMSNDGSGIGAALISASHSIYADN